MPAARPVLAASARSSSTLRSALTPQQRKLIDALLEAATHREAAKSVGVSERTVRRWLTLATFQQELSDRSRLLRQTATIALTCGAGAAARALVGMADGSVKADAARVTAARSVLEALDRAGEIEDVFDRLAELERRLKAADIDGDTETTS